MSLEAASSGTSAELVSPPFVTLEGIPNFRDLGGWRIANQPVQSFRRSLIFRCGEPTKATDDDIAKIRSLGVTHAFDLRSNPEIHKRQVSSSEGTVTEWPGIERIHSPVFPDESYDPASLPARIANYTTDDSEGMVIAYKTILEEGTASFGAMLRHLLHHPNNALLVHCTAGKDRTGVFCASVLSFAGVSDEVVAEEYHLTELGMGAWTETIVKAIMRSYDITEEGARRLAGARKSSILAALKTLRDDYGGASGYFSTKCGLSEEELTRLKRLLVTDEMPVCSLQNGVLTSSG